jgi:hypothetical protein
MSTEIKVNMKNVATIAQTFHKCLKELQTLGVQWNLADLAVAYQELMYEYRADLEKQKPRDKGMAM